MPHIPFDICILTASNEHQAKGYETQLEWRRQRGLLPETEFLVISDPGGQRIGSGGSTLYVLHILYQKYGAELLQKRMLMLHSGGDSRRLLAYSAVGKLFAPLPTPANLTLFDLMLENYAQLPALESGQVIVASGDVLLNFEPGFIEFSPHGITGVAYPEDPQQGQYFGVYVVENGEQHLKPVSDVLQKPNLQELESAGALDSQRIWIDTGILNLAPDAVEAFLQCKTLLRSFEKGELNYNLYYELVHAVHGKLDIPDASLLQAIDLYANCLPYCGFFHVGRSAEFLRHFYSLTHASVQYRFQNGVRSNAERFPELKSSWIFNSMIDNVSVVATSPSLIEGCSISADLKLDGNNLLTGLTELTRPLFLKKGNCLLLLPQQDGTWAAILYGILDHFKASYEPLFLNTRMYDVFESLGITSKELWTREDIQELWTAQLFPCAELPQDAVDAVLCLQHRGDLALWRRANRQSIQHILQHTDQNRMLQQRANLLRKFRLYNLSQEIKSDSFSFRDVQDLIRTPADVETIRQTLLAETERVDFKERAKLELWLAELAKADGKEANAETFYTRAFLSIRNAVNLGLQHSVERQDNRLHIRSDEVVWTLLPARLDFAGGWTDTPPICLDLGGCVLNASVTLNGQYPIQVVGKIRPDFVISINSIDLGQRVEITSIEELRNFTNPADWLSLPKAALYAAGLVPLEADGTLKKFLQRLGGGIDLTLFSALPSGSGLGTSSILGAGLIATLARILGHDMPRDELYARTSNLEQLMTTGGGWQDQIGGVAGGVKLITTKAGIDQTPTLAWTHLKQPQRDVSEQFLLYYTGYRRMAKNLLRKVVGRYLKRDAEAVETLQQLAALAQEMKTDLDHRRIETFGENIRSAWQLNKRLDQGQTTDDIEAILSRVDDYLLGAKLLGAGGGGFLFMVPKDKTAAKRIRNILEQDSPNSRARFFDFDVDAAGMKISVL